MDQNSKRMVACGVRRGRFERRVVDMTAVGRGGHPSTSAKSRISLRRENKEGGANGKKTG